MLAELLQSWCWEGTVDIAADLTELPACHSGTMPWGTMQASCKHTRAQHTCCEQPFWRCSGFNSKFLTKCCEALQCLDLSGASPTFLACWEFLFCLNLRFRWDDFFPRCLLFWLLPTGRYSCCILIFSEVAYFAEVAFRYVWQTLLVKSMVSVMSARVALNRNFETDLSYSAGYRKYK